ncbi:MAG: GTPase domain-containing protein [candidate division KSB1 bacterium]|nr:GTPase domain-containing protein [candidate division KSB1 bacterium]MDZ7318391.1 GTPase domain-containing protein [candidate division KSB1 bacterium]MDZ7340065.1 GTPase domain-containing protein [candidate division KSB1 bacterium]
MLVNWAQQEISLKIVYYGPGLSGKTTNLRYIYDHLNPSLRGDLITLNTREDRTLFFDFLQLDLGTILGRKPRFNLYTVPGQVVYAYSRKVILSGVDGIVYVADAQLGRMDDNCHMLLDLEENLISIGRTLKNVPMVLQLNKWDLPNIAAYEILQQRLNIFGAPCFTSVATKGIGVFESLKAIINLILKQYQDRHQPAMRQEREYASSKIIS